MAGRSRFHYIYESHYGDVASGILQVSAGEGAHRLGINYCCLYLIGLKGKDIGDYINLKRHYNYGSAIRMKLGLTENDTNLSLYLKKMLKNM